MFFFSKEYLPIGRQKLYSHTRFFFSNPSYRVSHYTKITLVLTKVKNENTNAYLQVYFFVNAMH